MKRTSNPDRQREAQQAVVDRARRQQARDYHRAIDHAISEAEGIADLIRPEDLQAAAYRLMHTAETIRQALTTGDTQAAHTHAIEAAGEALGVAATLTTREG